MSAGGATPIRSSKVGVRSQAWTNWWRTPPLAAILFGQVMMKGSRMLAAMKNVQPGHLLDRELAELAARAGSARAGMPSDAAEAV